MTFKEKRMEKECDLISVKSYRINKLKSAVKQDIEIALNAVIAGMDMGRLETLKEIDNKLFMDGRDKTLLYLRKEIKDIQK